MPKRKRNITPVPDIEENDDESYLSDNGSPLQRNAANARERARMRVLSSAFYRLKTIIPWVPRDTKLSKLDTLRLATNYITFLASTLDGEPMNDIMRHSSQTQKLTWPFIFQRMPEINKTNIKPNQTKHESSDDKWYSEHNLSSFSENSIYKADQEYADTNYNYHNE